MTKNEAKEAALRWLDEATVNGSEPVSGELEDYRDRMNYLLDGVVNGLAAIFPLSGVVGMTHCPPKNLLGEQRKVIRVMPGEVLTLEHKQAGSVYLEISGDAVVMFPEGQAVRTEGNGFSPVRGNLTNGCGVTLMGDEPFLVRHAALYDCTYREAERIPAYAPMVPAALPDDFRRLRRVVRQYAGGEEECTDWRCEDGKALLLPWEKWGEYRVYYDRRPERLAHDAADDTVLDCDPLAESLIPLKLAADLAVGTLDRAQTGFYLEERYAAMLRTVQTSRPGEQVRIQPVYAAV